MLYILDSNRVVYHSNVYDIPFQVLAKRCVTSTLNGPNIPKAQASKFSRHLYILVIFKMAATIHARIFAGATDFSVKYTVNTLWFGDFYAHFNSVQPFKGSKHARSNGTVWYDNAVWMVSWVPGYSPRPNCHKRSFYTLHRPLAYILRQKNVLWRHAMLPRSFQSKEGPLVAVCTRQKQHWHDYKVLISVSSGTTQQSRT